MKKLLVVLILFCSFMGFAQQRVLLHIKQTGEQEAILLKPGELVRTAIAKHEKIQQNNVQLLQRSKNKFNSEVEKEAIASSNEISPNKRSSVQSTIKYFNYDTLLTTNFGFNHQDVAFQWYVPQGSGVVKEFWWRNYVLKGNTGKGIVRAWRANPRLKTLPLNAVSDTGIAYSNGNLGWYSKLNDNDGLVTPFKNEATNSNFISGKNNDPNTMSFDPLGIEANWHLGGVQFTLDTNKWQGFQLPAYGDTLKFSAGELIGFTLQNDSKITDVNNSNGNDVRMELSAIQLTGVQSHSLKFYELERNTSQNNPGWHNRGYDWGMYVVVDYVSQSSITLNAPVGGQSWEAGSLQNISWNVDPGISKINIAWKRSTDTSWFVIANGFDGTIGNFRWLVSTTQTAQAQIRISDAANTANFVTSNFFAITPPKPADVNWAKQFGDTINFYAVKAVDNNTVFAVGKNYTSNFPVVMKTTNGGATWFSAKGNLPNNASLSTVEAYSSQQAWVGDWNGNIYSTTNGGTTWNVTASVAGSYIDKIKLVGTNLVALGDATSKSDKLVILRSTDAGTSWVRNTNIPFTDSLDFAYLGALDVVGNSIYFGTAYGKVLRSIDAGLTWTIIGQPLGWVNGIGFANETFGVALNSASYDNIRKTNNAGNAWSPLYNLVGLTNQVQFLKNVTPTFGWMVGSRGLLMKTTDAGSTWVQQNLGTTEFLYDVSYTSENNGWVVTNSGSILKYATNPSSTVLNNFDQAASDPNFTKGWSGVGSLTLTNNSASPSPIEGLAAMKATWTVHSSETYGGFIYLYTSRFPNNATSIDLSSANYLSLWYYNQTPSSKPGLVNLRIKLWDAGGLSKYQTDPADHEEWYFEKKGVFETASGWNRLLIPLKDNGLINPNDKGFSLPGFSGKDNNGMLDLNKIVGFNIEWTTPGIPNNGTASGVILFDNFGAVKIDTSVDNTSLITFQANMDSLMLAGFNPVTDSIVVNGQFNRWGSKHKMYRLGSTTIWQDTIRYAGYAGDTIQYKFKVFPENKFNGGWESDPNRKYVFTGSSILPPVRPNIKGLQPTGASWNFAKSFPNDGFKVTSGGHGITVDPDGKIWFQAFGVTDSIKNSNNQLVPTRSIYVFNPNGTQAAFSPIKIISVNGVSDTLFNSNRGLTKDENGNIIVSSFDILYRVNYKTGAGMNKVIPTPGSTLTAAAVDKNGNIFTAHVIPGGSIKIFDKNFNYIGKVIDTTSGFSRVVAVSGNGNEVYFAGYTNKAVYRYVSQNGVLGPYVNRGMQDTLLRGMSVESMSWDPKTNNLWVSSGSGNDIPASNFTFNTWYAFNPSINAIVDSIKWNDVNNGLESKINIRPRGIAFSSGGDSSYVTCFGSNLVPAIQMFVRGQVINPVPVTHTITFRADMNRLVGAGFNPATDSIIVNGSFNGWNSTTRMQSIGGNIYSYSVPINTTPGQKLEFKFRAFPPNKFSNSGWELDQNTVSHNREFYFVDADQTLPNLDPIITVLQPSAKMGITQTDIDFIGIRIGQTSDITISLIDSAISAANLSGNISLAGFNNWFTIVSGGGAYNLAPGQSQNIVIRYNAAVAGFAKAALTVTNNSSNMPNTLTIPVTGYGVQAVQTPKKILVDTKHGFYGNSIDSNYFAETLNLLRTAGHNVITNQTVFNPTGYDYLVSITQKDLFTTSEVSQIQNFVKSGGSFVLLGDHSGAFGRNNQNILLSDTGWNTGIKIDSTFIKDSTQSILGRPYWIKVSNFAKDGNLFVGVDTLGVFASASISVVSPAQIIMTTSPGGSNQAVYGSSFENITVKKNRFEQFINDGESISIQSNNLSPVTDFSSTYKIDEITNGMVLPSTAYSTIPLGAKVNIGSGRIIVLGDVNIFSQSFQTIPGQSGLGLRFGSNRVFALNLFRGSSPVTIPTPKITSIKDVPNDNGKQVTVQWSVSSPAAASGITKFGIWRRDTTSMLTFIRVFETLVLNDTMYAAVVPTLFDSTKAKGMVWSTFQVSSHGASADIFAVSKSDSGYSVDNLSPQVPNGLAASFVSVSGVNAVQLKWNAVADKDLQYYQIYRDTVQGFIPGVANLLKNVADTSYADNSIKLKTKYYYKIIAVDYSGNGSNPSTEVVVTTTSVQKENEIPTVYSLSQNFPNPFNPTTTIKFGLPEASNVSLKVYDVIGREVTTLVNDQLTPGYYFYNWNANGISSGMYIYRITATSVNGEKKQLFNQVKKLLLMK